MNPEEAGRLEEPFSAKQKILTVAKLAKLSGISTRTLRYYDAQGLLHPARVTTAGYRIYGEKEIDLLQAILFYRELGFALADIKAIITDPNFNREAALLGHLEELRQRRERLDELICNVQVSLATMRGDAIMNDNEKFRGFVKGLIDENEQKYGAEVREKYGDDAVDKSNAKLAGITQEQYEHSERLRQEFEETLLQAFNSGDPAGEFAKRACELHKQWLCVYYPDYSAEYHMALGEMYVADERFRANYDKLAPNCTEFLRDAINAYAQIN